MSTINLWAYKHQDRENAWVAVGYFSNQEDALSECISRGLSEDEKATLKKVTENEKFS